MTPASAPAPATNHLYFATTTHVRFHPVRHAFTYPVLYAGIDLDKLERGDVLGPAWHWLWGYNRLAVFALRDEDYLGKMEMDGIGKSIRAKLLWHLDQRGIPTSDLTRLTLVTTPRFLSYAFNPVSFYFAYSGPATALTLRAIVLEVNNTFGEKHLYILDGRTYPTPPKKSLRGGRYDHAFLIDRTFHVSPFNDRSGQYEALCRDPLRDGPTSLPNLDMRLIVHNNPDTSLPDLNTSGKKFMAEVHATGVILTPGALARAAFVYPAVFFLTIPRITWEAARLAYAKGLRVYPRPEPLKSGNSGAKETIGWKPADKGELFFAALVFEWWAHLLRTIPGYETTQIMVYPPNPHAPADLIPSPVTPATTTIHLHLSNYAIFPALALFAYPLHALLITYASNSWSCHPLPSFLRLFPNTTSHLTSSISSSPSSSSSSNLNAHIRNAHWRHLHNTPLASHVIQSIPQTAKLPFPIPTPEGPQTTSHLLDERASSVVYTWRLMMAATGYNVEKTLFGLLARFVGGRDPFEAAARTWEAVAGWLRGEERDDGKGDEWERVGTFLEALGVEKDV